MRQPRFYWLIYALYALAFGVPFIWLVSQQIICALFGREKEREWKSVILFSIQTNSKSDLMIVYPVLSGDRSRLLHIAWFILILLPVGYALVWTLNISDSLFTSSMSPLSTACIHQQCRRSANRNCTIHCHNASGHLTPEVYFDFSFRSEIPNNFKYPKQLSIPSSNKYKCFSLE